MREKKATVNLSNTWVPADLSDLTLRQRAELSFSWRHVNSPNCFSVYIIADLVKCGVLTHLSDILRNRNVWLLAIKQYDSEGLSVIKQLSAVIKRLSAGRLSVIKQYDLVVL